MPMPPNDLDTEYSPAELAKAEAATPRLIPVLRSLGTEYEPRPDWQQRVFDVLDQERRAKRRARIMDVVYGALAGMAAAAVVMGIVAWLAGWL